jgi:hypothetical protein
MGLSLKSDIANFLDDVIVPIIELSKEGTNFAANIIQRWGSYWEKVIDTSDFFAGKQERGNLAFGSFVFGFIWPITTSIKAFLYYVQLDIFNHENFLWYYLALKKNPDELPPCELSLKEIYVTRGIFAILPLPTSRITFENFQKQALATIDNYLKTNPGSQNAFNSAKEKLSKIIPPDTWRTAAKEIFGEDLIWLNQKNRLIEYHKKWWKFVVSLLVCISAWLFLVFDTLNFAVSTGAIINLNVIHMVTFLAPIVPWIGTAITFIFTTIDLVMITKNHLDLINGKGFNGKTFKKNAHGNWVYLKQKGRKALWYNDYELLLDYLTAISNGGAIAISILATSAIISVPTAMITTSTLMFLLGSINLTRSIIRKHQEKSKSKDLVNISPQNRQTSAAIQQPTSPDLAGSMVPAAVSFVTANELNLYATIMLDCLDYHFKSGITKNPQKKQEALKKFSLTNFVQLSEFTIQDNPEQLFKDCDNRLPYFGFALPELDIQNNHLVSLCTQVGYKYLTTHQFLSKTTTLAALFFQDRQHEILSIKCLKDDERIELEKIKKLTIAEIEQNKMWINLVGKLAIIEKLVYKLHLGNFRYTQGMFEISRSIMSNINLLLKYDNINSEIDIITVNNKPNCIIDLKRFEKTKVSIHEKCGIPLIKRYDFYAGQSGRSTMSLLAQNLELQFYLSAILCFEPNGYCYRLMLDKKGAPKEDEIVFDVQGEIITVKILDKEDFSIPKSDPIYNTIMSASKDKKRGPGFTSEEIQQLSQSEILRNHPQPNAKKLEYTFEESSENKAILTIESYGAENETAKFVKKLFTDGINSKEEMIACTKVKLEIGARALQHKIKLAKRANDNNHQYYLLLLSKLLLDLTTSQSVEISPVSEEIIKSELSNLTLEEQADLPAAFDHVFDYTLHNLEGACKTNTLSDLLCNRMQQEIDAARMKLAPAIDCSLLKLFTAGMYFKGDITTHTQEKLNVGIPVLQQKIKQAGKANHQYYILLLNKILLYQKIAEKKANPSAPTVILAPLTNDEQIDIPAALKHLFDYALHNLNGNCQRKTLLDFLYIAAIPEIVASIRTNDELQQKIDIARRKTTVPTPNPTN